MEEGDIEFLVQNLPRDLAEFVHQNNSEFKDECIRWDKEQEERKRLEESQQELAQQQAQGGSSGLNSSGMDPNNDVLVSLPAPYTIFNSRSILMDILAISLTYSERPSFYRLSKKS